MGGERKAAAPEHRSELALTRVSEEPHGANAAIVAQAAGGKRRSPRGRTEGFIAEEDVVVSII